MAYDMTEPGALPPWDADTLARFKRGKDRERDMLIDLERIGRLVQPEFERIGGQEPFILVDRKGRKAVSGKVDARIRFVGDKSGGHPVEAKSWSPNITAGLQSFEDVLEGKWTRSGGYQLLMYMLGMGQELGFMLLDKPGIPEMLPVELETHIEQAEQFWAKAEEATAYVHGEGPIPAFYEDIKECKQCPFYGAVCDPPIKMQEGVSLITDEYLLQRITHYLELRDALEAAGLDEFKAVDKELKDRLRGVEDALAGGARIIGKWGKQSTVVLPNDLKAEWDAIRKEYTRSDPRGKFTLKILKA